MKVYIYIYIHVPYTLYIVLVYIHPCCYNCSPLFEQIIQNTPWKLIHHIDY